jgi:hypothetical protein
LKEIVMQFADGFGYSPDSGEFQIKDNKAYWEDGDITDMSVGVFRWVPITKAREHYADWTDEQRAAAKAAYAEKARQYEEEQAKMPATTIISLDDEQLQLIMSSLQSWSAHLNMLPGDHLETQAKISQLVQYLGTGGEMP